MVFEKASTRTRASFEIAMFELGGHALYLGTQGSQLGRGEPIRDTARVLSALLPRHHGAHVRAGPRGRDGRVRARAGHQRLHGLSAPCQVLADLQTVAQRYKDRGDVAQILRSVKYAWVGDGNNMANSWIEAAGILGLDLALACPAGFEPEPASTSGRGATERGRITLVRDPAEAVAGRQVISTDVFASMGQEDEAEARRRAFAATASTPPSWPRPPRTPSCCTACRPTATRRSPTRSSRGRRAWSGNRREPPARPKSAARTPHPMTMTVPAQLKTAPGPAESRSGEQLGRR
jgi:hypothetical protein